MHNRTVPCSEQAGLHTHFTMGDLNKHGHVMHDPKVLKKYQ